MLRLQSSRDIERVWREGRSHAHPLAILIACRRVPEPEAASSPSRCGFVAGKKVGSAVVRNRAKRLLREAVRLQPGAPAEGWDLIFVARPALVGATQRQVDKAVGELLKRSNVVH